MPVLRERMAIVLYVIKKWLEKKASLLGISGLVCIQTVIDIKCGCLKYLILLDFVT